MATPLEEADVLHEWGIEPVPETHRRFSTFDTAVLWGDLGIGLLVLVAGALLVPGLGAVEAFWAIVIGSLVGVALLALVARSGADHGLPTMVLFRPVLGIKGSWVPSALNALQLIGWTAVELWAMSFVADLISRRIFGFSARPLWLVIFAVVCTSLAWWGPIGVTRVWMERFAAWTIAAVCLVVTVLALTSDLLVPLLSIDGTGDLPFGAGIDLVIAMPISWLPLVADYGRFARNGRAASRGTFVGYFIANVWLYSLGALLVLGANANPSPEGIAIGVFTLAWGAVAGVLFLVGLLAGETDEAFADIYSGAVSLQNIFPNVSQRVLIGSIGGLGALLAGWLTMERYESFLFLIGSVFVPLFGIFVADHFVNRRGKVDVPELYQGKGRYWFAGGFRGSTLLAWFVGFVVFHWFVPVGPGWWTELVGSVFETPLSVKFPWLGGSIPAFVIAFLLALRPGLYHATSNEGERA